MYHLLFSDDPANNDIRPLMNFIAIALQLTIYTQWVFVLMSELEKAVFARRMVILGVFSIALGQTYAVMLACACPCGRMLKFPISTFIAYGLMAHGVVCLYLASQIMPLIAYSPPAARKDDARTYNHNLQTSQSRPATG